MAEEGILVATSGSHSTLEGPLFGPGTTLLKQLLESVYVCVGGCSPLPGCPARGSCPWRTQENGSLPCFFWGGGCARRGGHCQYNGDPCNNSSHAELGGGVGGGSGLIPRFHLFCVLSLYVTWITCEPRKWADLTIPIRGGRPPFPLEAGHFLTPFQWWHSWRAGGGHPVSAMVWHVLCGCPMVLWPAWLLKLDDAHR